MSIPARKEPTTLEVRLSDIHDVRKHPLARQKAVYDVVAMVEAGGDPDVLNAYGTSPEKLWTEVLLAFIDYAQDKKTMANWRLDNYTQALHTMGNLGWDAPAFLEQHGISEHTILCDIASAFLNKSAGGETPVEIYYNACYARLMMQGLLDEQSARDIKWAVYNHGRGVLAPSLGSAAEKRELMLTLAQSFADLAAKPSLLPVDSTPAVLKLCTEAGYKAVELTLVDMGLGVQRAKAGLRAPHA